jgi:hypothetical protein
MHSVFLYCVNNWRSRTELKAYFTWPMLYILIINTFIGLYNLEYFATAVLISVIFNYVFY